MCNMLWKLNKVSSSAVIELPKINSFCMSCMLKEIHEVEQKISWNLHFSYFSFIRKSDCWYSLYQNKVEWWFSIAIDKHITIRNVKDLILWKKFLEKIKGLLNARKYDMRNENLFISCVIYLCKIGRCLTHIVLPIIFPKM